MRTIAAVDVGGTSIKGAVVTAGGQVLWQTDARTPVAAGPDQVVRRVRDVVADLLRHPGAQGVEAVGLVVPGSVDSLGGVARFAANLGWRDVPLRTLVAEDTGLPTVLDHDVRAAGIAESRLGRTRGVADSLLAVIGTGIAGVITVNGQVVRGATGLSGEIGHLPIWPAGEACPCGQVGCLERYASAAGISRRYEATTGRTASAAEIAELTDQDADAARVWAEAIEALGIGLASCTMTFDPELIVVGGGLSGAGSALLEPLRLALARRVRWRPPPGVELSELGAQGGLIGAALLAADRAGVEVTGWGSRPVDGQPGAPD